MGDVPTTNDSEAFVAIPLAGTALFFSSNTWNAVWLVEVTTMGSQPAFVLVPFVGAANNIAPCSPALVFVASENGMLAEGDVVGCVGITVPEG